MRAEKTSVKIKKNMIYNNTTANINKTNKKDKPSFINTHGISNSSSSYNSYSNKNNDSNNISSSNYEKKTTKKKELELNTDNQEKRKLMKGLFYGMGDGEEEKQFFNEEINKIIQMGDLSKGNN